MRHILKLSIFALLLACGGDSTNPRSAAGLSGEWRFTEDLVNDHFYGETCHLTGFVTIHQDGSSISADLRSDVPGSTNEACYGDGQLTSTFFIEGPLGSGRVVGLALSFSDGSDTYTGTLDGLPASRAAGSLRYDGRDLGTWTLTR